MVLIIALHYFAGKNVALHTIKCEKKEEAYQRCFCCKHNLSKDAPAEFLHPEKFMIKAMTMWR